MNTLLSLLAAGLFLSTHAALAAGVTIPQRQPPESFQKMTEDWPFALATPAAVVAEPVIGWASNYRVAGIGKNYQDGKEEVFVAIKSNDARESFSLFGTQPNHDHEDIAVVTIEWNDKVLESRVTLKKGSEFATIGFDQAGAQAAAAQNALNAQQMQLRPGNPNVPGGLRQPPIRPLGTPGAPGVAVPRPTMLPQQPPQAVPLPGAPGNTNAAPVPANTNINVAPQNPKQRVRVIKSTP